VVGAGAIGGITAGFMAKSGHDVILITKYPDLAEKIREEGLLITGVKGTHRVKMKAYPRISDLKDQVDIVFLATKATDMEETAEQILPFIHEKSLVVSMQNGICEYRLAKIVGVERTVGCVVGWGATMVQQGHLEMTSTGQFWIGYIHRQSADEGLETVKSLLETVVPVTITPNIIAELYSKLIINSAITSMGAVTGLYLGEMLANGKIRRIFIEIMREALEVADTMGLQVPAYEGKLNYYRLVNAKGLWGNFYRYVVLRVVGFKYRKLKSSSLQSLERGKPTEVDYLNGFIVRKAKELGIRTPVNEKIVEMIKEIELGRRKISTENVEEILHQIPST
jgi:2-dehydropantoate 2-reductase